MSETLDVNVLVYASSTASPFQEQARAALERFAAGPQLRYLLWPVIMGYLRIITDRRVIDAPLTPDAAARNVEDLLDRPNLLVVTEEVGFWDHYRRLAASVRPTGKLVPDAHIVALMHQHGIGTIWTHDRGFRRFDGITVRDPFG
jgi:toxin-antitoxin system PIN domain toxin